MLQSLKGRSGKFAVNQLKFSETPPPSFRLVINFKNNFGNNNGKILTVGLKLAKILTVNRKGNNPIETPL